MVLKLLVAMFRIVWILDSSATRYVSDNWTRVLNLTAYKDFYHIASKKKLTIKGKKIITLTVWNTVLRLLDILKLLLY